MGWFDNIGRHLTQGLQSLGMWAPMASRGYPTQIAPGIGRLPTTARTTAPFTPKGTAKVFPIQARPTVMVQPKPAVLVSRGFAKVTPIVIAYNPPAPQSITADSTGCVIC